MPDKPDVINEANILLAEANKEPIKNVLADYVAYLTAHPEVAANPDLSHALSAQLQPILPNLIIEDIKESTSSSNSTSSSASGTGENLTATETQQQLETLAAENSPRSAFAKLLLDEKFLLQQAGVVSADGQTFQLGMLKIDSTTNRLTIGNSGLTEQFLSDGTGIWRDGSNSIVAVQFVNGMIVHLSGSDQSQISSAQDLFKSNLIPTEIDYPDGSRLRKDPATDNAGFDKGWFFTDVKANRTYPANAPTYKSSYFSSLKDSYTISLMDQGNSNNNSVSNEATFNFDGNMIVYSRVNANDPTQNILIDSTAGHQILQLPGKPEYRQVGANQWEVSVDNGQAGFSWKPVADGDIPKIVSTNGLLDVRLGPDGPGGVDRGPTDPDSAGKHLAFYPNGVNYDADYQRTFSGNVQIFDLRGATTTLSGNGIVAVPEVATIVLPDHSTIQMGDDGKWTHYAYSQDPSRPFDRGIKLGTVTQPYYETFASGNLTNTDAHVVLISDNPDAPPVPITESNSQYELQVNGALETFNQFSGLVQVQRRDGSVIQFSDTDATHIASHPVSISFDKVNASAGVNTSKITYDAKSPTHWMRDGKPVTVDFDAVNDYQQITITDADGNQDIFHGGGLPPEHVNATIRAKPADQTQQSDSSTIAIANGSSIELKNGTPVSVTLNDSELGDLALISRDAKHSSVTLPIPTPASTGYSVQVTTNPLQVTVTELASGTTEIFDAQNVTRFG
jgi:hypothetical protein